MEVHRNFFRWNFEYRVFILNTLIFRGGARSEKKNGMGVTLRSRFCHRQLRIKFLFSLINDLSRSVVSNQPNTLSSLSAVHCNSAYDCGEHRSRTATRSFKVMHNHQRLRLPTARAQHYSSLPQVGCYPRIRRCKPRRNVSRLHIWGGRAEWAQSTTATLINLSKPHQIL